MLITIAFIIVVFAWCLIRQEKSFNKSIQILEERLDKQDRTIAHLYEQIEDSK